MKELDVIEMLRMHRYLREMFKNQLSQEQISDMAQRNDFVIIDNDSDVQNLTQQESNRIGVLQKDQEDRIDSLPGSSINIDVIE